MNSMTKLFAQVRSLLAAIANKQETEVKPSEPFETEVDENVFDEATEMSRGEEEDKNEEVDSGPARTDDDGYNASGSSEC